MRHALLPLVLALLIPAGSIFAQEIEGVYTGTDTSRGFRAVCKVRVTETVPGTDVFVLSGSVAVAPIGHARALTLTLKGEQVGSQASGTLKNNAPGRKKLRVPFTGGPIEILNEYDISFDLRGFGQFTCQCYKKLDISGIWSFTDGRTGPMTITKNDQGGFDGFYSGTEAAGHPDLRGILSGLLSRKGKWSGQFTIFDGPAVVNGEFNLNYVVTPGGRPALVGTFTTSEIPSDIVLIKTG